MLPNIDENSETWVIWWVGQLPSSSSCLETTPVTTEASDHQRPNELEAIATSALKIMRESEIMELVKLISCALEQLYLNFSEKLCFSRTRETNMMWYDMI